LPVGREWHPIGVEIVERRGHRNSGAVLARQCCNARADNAGPPISWRAEAS
jgi:hypothetical protein